MRVVQWRFWLEGEDNESYTYETDVVSASLEMEEGYTNPEDVYVEAIRIQMSDFYSYRDWQDEVTREYADEGSKWALLMFRAENKADSPKLIPFRDDVVLLSGSSQFDPVYINKEEDMYESGEVQPGVVREGWIPYEIPASLSRDDLQIIYSGSDFEGEWRVVWQP